MADPSLVDDDLFSLDQTADEYYARGNVGGPPFEHSAASKAESLASMREREQRSFRAKCGFNSNAEYVRERKWIAERVSSVCNELSLSLVTRSMALEYFDALLQNCSSQKQWLVACCCILIAAKFEERDDFVPRVKHLGRTCFRGMLGRAEAEAETHLIVPMESVVLKYLDWRLNVVTPVHFLRFFLNEGVVDASVDTIDGRRAGEDEEYAVHMFAAFLVDKVMCETQFQRFLPSVLAVSILAASRLRARVQPVWRDGLEHLTGFAEEQFDECRTALVQFHRCHYPVALSAEEEAAKNSSPIGVEDLHGAGQPRHAPNIAETPPQVSNTRRMRPAVNVVNVCGSISEEANDDDDDSTVAKVIDGNDDDGDDDGDDDDDVENCRHINKRLRTK